MKLFVVTMLTLAVLSLAVVLPARAVAQDREKHGGSPDVTEQRKSTNHLVRTVREATERFRDVEVAEAEGYHLLFGCVSGDSSGAMGLHYVNLDLVADATLDPTRPESVIYEPAGHGKLRLIGADFLVFADAWNAKNASPPQLAGQLFHLFESPNRFGLPAFYTLHVWAWKDNPTGTFVNWHANVSCDRFNPQN